MAEKKKAEKKTEKKKFNCEILLPLDEKNIRGNKVKLQVVRWNKYSPVLEKREYWDKDGEEITGKCKGFNNEDFDIITENLEKIQELLDKEFKDKK